MKVQTDVAQLSRDDPQAQEKALTQLHAGIDRASRLVDQLLTLSRLDSLDNLDDVEPIVMADLLQSAVMDIWYPAQQAGIDIRLNINAPQVKHTGQQLLLSLLVARTGGDRQRAGALYCQAYCCPARYARLTGECRWRWIQREN